MLQITDGKSVFMVSSGAFETIYKRQGFRVLEAANGSKVVATQQDIADAIADADVEQSQTNDDLEEKPISQWSKAEVKAYAEQHGIDLTGTRNVNEAKEIIKAAMSV